MTSPAMRFTYGERGREDDEPVPLATVTATFVVSTRYASAVHLAVEIWESLEWLTAGGGHDAIRTLDLVFPPGFDD